MYRSVTLLATLTIMLALTTAVYAGNDCAHPFAIPGSGQIGGPISADESFWYSFDAAYGECWAFEIPQMPVGFSFEVMGGDCGKTERIAGPLAEPGYIQHKFENAGRYYLLVKGGDGAVFYSLTASAVLCDPHERNEECGTGPFLEKGKPLEASIGIAGDYDWYRFEIDDPICLTFAVRPTPGESYPSLTLWVLNTPGGCMGGGAGAAGGPAGTRLTCFFTDPGTYYLRVSRDNAAPEPALGFYTLAVAECPPHQVDPPVGETP